MKKISVLHIVEELKIGGLERIIFEIATKLNKDEYNVNVWCITRGGRIAKELLAAGINVRILGIDSYYNPLNILRLARYFKRLNPDIVHSHTYFSNTIGRIAGKLAQVSVIITHVHNTYHNYSKRNHLIERVLSVNTDKIICCSKAVRNYVLKTEKIEARKTIVINNGIDLRLFHEQGSGSTLRKSLKMGDNVPVVITVASLTEKKGHRYLLKALKIIKGKCNSLKALIVGDGPLRHELRNIAGEYGLQDSVIFTGQREDIRELLEISDLFVLPSLQEGLPLAVIEAMSTGLPVIATAVGGVPDVIDDGKTGILVPFGNLEALSNAVLTLLADPKKKERIGRCGQRAAIDNFGSEKMVAEVDKLYRACLLRKKRNFIKV